MSTPAEIRALAAQTVAQVADRGQSLDALLDRDSGTPQERGLLRSLCYGTLRWHIRMSALLGELLTQRPQSLDPEVRALALVGLFQLMHTDIAPHAAVSETVEAVRVLRYPRAAGLVNAVLRRCQREGAGILARLDADPSVRTSHPRWLVDSLHQDWGAEAEGILDANNAHPPFWLRVNRRRSTAESYREQLQAAGVSSQTSEFAPEGLLLPAAVDVRALPGFDAGVVSVQDAAAQLAAHLVAPRAGDRVLDACAAPGGKTCHLLELEPAISELVAVDSAAWRLARVRENLQRLQLNATLLTADAGEPGEWWDGIPFDRILLDVPCSATGVIRRHPDVKLLRRSEDIAKLSAQQARMLARTWPLLAPGGRLVYASCSVLQAESAVVVGEFLEQHAEARDTTAQAISRWSAGTQEGPGWRIRTGHAAMDGFYYACIEKSHN